LLESGARVGGKEETMLSVIGAFLFIFCCRVIDVSMGTLRMLYTVRGRKYLAGALGAVEVGVFLVAISKVVSSANDPARFLGYCLGFGAGVVLGITIENWLAPGNTAVSIISREAWSEISTALRDVGFGVTETIGRGKDGLVHIIHSTIRRRDFPYLMQVVKEIDANAFITTGEAHFVYRGYWHKIKRK